MQNGYSGLHTLGLSEGQELSLGMGVYSEENPAWLHHNKAGYVFLAGDKQLIVSAEPRLLDAEAIDVFTLVCTEWSA